MDIRIRAFLQISYDHGKTWIALNNGRYVELTNRTALFDVEDKGISIKGIIVTKNKSNDILIGPCPRCGANMTQCSCNKVIDAAAPGNSIVEN